jgi:methylmalonyl-CoA mutase N-terminal domain/subunit
MKEKSVKSEEENQSRERWQKRAAEELGTERVEGSSPPLLGIHPDKEIEYYLTRLGFPGEFPYTRGIHPGMYRTKVWTMRQRVGFGTAKITNARLRTLLKDGETGLSVALDYPTQTGHDADHPKAKGKVGRSGVSVSTLDDMRTLVEEIPIDKVAISMNINATSPILLSMMVLAGEARGIPRSLLMGTIQNDILKEFAVKGRYIFPPEPSLRFTTDVIEFVTEEMPKWNSISVSGYHMRQAGATAAQEVAFTIADAVAYARAVEERGIAMDNFLPRLTFLFSSSVRVLEEVAKFRAARRIWANISKDVLGAKSPKSQMLRFHAQTDLSTLAVKQPELNVIRTSLEALAAILGGAQSVATNALDEISGPPSEAAARLALRTQQIIAEESAVANTVDPVGGAWAIEDMTDSIEEDAMAYLSEIEKLGGAVVAMENGYIRNVIAGEAIRRAKDIEEGKESFVGVRSHVDTEEGFSLIPAVPKGKVEAELKKAENEAARAVKAYRSSRKGKGVETALAALSSSTERRENVMGAVIVALKKGATLGEISGVWRELYGEYREPAQ